MGEIKHYFVRGNTAAGLHSLVESACAHVRHLVVIDGYPGLTEQLLQQLAGEWEGRGVSMHLLHQPLDSSKLEGILVPVCKLAIIDGDAWGEAQASPEADVQRIKLDGVLDQEQLAGSREELDRLAAALQQAYELAYATFERTLRIHDDWEAIYIDALDRQRMNRLAVEWFEEAVGTALDAGASAEAGVGSGAMAAGVGSGVAATETGAGDAAGAQAGMGERGELAGPGEQGAQGEPGAQGERGMQADVQGEQIHRFLGAATAAGAVDYVMNLTEHLHKRVFVKGRPGSGKSTLFKKLAQVASSRGLAVEMYHCGFDPNSLDMLIFPQLGTAIFDSTAPHEHFPSREGDSILDIYELAIASGTDERHAAEIAEVRASYAASMKRSIGYLAEARQVREQIIALYAKALDALAWANKAEGLRKRLGALLEAGQVRPD